MIIGALLFWTVPDTRMSLLGGIGLEALLWGAVDALIAVYAILKRKVTLKTRRIFPDEVRDVRETVRLRRLLVLNARLDLVYIALGGGAAVVFRADPFILGNGLGIVIQGLFLLVFDRYHALELPSEAPSWYDPVL